MDTLVVGPVQGRWGWYACDKETYKKLKRLNYLLFLHQRVSAAYDRWAMKDPQNRISKKWSRNDKGQKIGYTLGEVIPEPKKGCDAFNERVQTGKWTYVSISSLICEDYRNARYPKATAEEVKPVVLIADKIDNLLKTAETWHAS